MSDKGKAEQVDVPVPAEWLDPENPIEAEAEKEITPVEVQVTAEVVGAGLNVKGIDIAPVKDLYSDEDPPGMIIDEDPDCLAAYNSGVPSVRVKVGGITLTTYATWEEYNARRAEVKVYIEPLGLSEEIPVPSGAEREPGAALAAVVKTLLGQLTKSLDATIEEVRDRGVTWDGEGGKRPAGDAGEVVARFAQATEEDDQEF